MWFSIHQPAIFIYKSFIIFPFYEKFICWNNIYNIIFPNSMFCHTLYLSLLIAVVSKIAVLTSFRIIAAMLKILPKNFMYSIIKSCNCSFNSSPCIRICYHRITIFFSRIVEMHFAYLLSGSLFNKISIDL